MGKQETAKKIGRDNGLVSEARGPRPKAKRKSLKLASQEMKKAVMPTACMLDNDKGTMKK
ncbi:hypothetical protein DY000_02055899 [Brassica cretica]|uniref:Uncharacterized protein n=1 Tax=Brassica cretica TaxID=69181 RepID=A0ABQ7AGH2_BRACR|nr:hypothetical protein DY000_02055899 [Brassica cretica]